MYFLFNLSSICSSIISVATALCNAVISNLTGIFLTPALLLHFFGKSIELPFLDLVKKLCSKVLLPVAIGQALRSTSMKEAYSKHTGFFKRFQEVRCIVEVSVISITKCGLFLITFYLLTPDCPPWHRLECFLQCVH